MPIIRGRYDKVILGIDPGQNGGITYIYNSEGIITTVSSQTMPETEKSIYEALLTLSMLSKHVFAYIENVHSFPGQGVASSFKFGMGYGGLRMALTALDIPFETVSPQRWQKDLNIPKRNPKENQRLFKLRLVAKAQQLFPKLEVWKANRGKQLSVADSILIAEWGRRKQQQQ